MADTPDQDPRTDGEASAEPGPSKGFKLAALVDKFLTKKCLAILLGISLLGHAVGLAVMKLKPQGPQEATTAEISLGDYEFVAPRAEPGEVTAATFSLHLALLDGVDAPAETTDDHGARRPPVSTARERQPMPSPPAR